MDAASDSDELFRGVGWVDDLLHLLHQQQKSNTKVIKIPRNNNLQQVTVPVSYLLFAVKSVARSTCV